MSTDLALTWDQGKFEFQRKLGNFVQYFQVNLPTNAHGVPLQIIDPLHIAENMLNCDTTDDVPDAVVIRATRAVDFEEGLPILDGTPIWERFEGESLEYYKLFKEYRESLYTAGVRAISKLADTLSMAGRDLNVLAKVYHWQLRCKAYDVFRRMERERKRLFEVEQLESKHSKAANTLMEQAMTYLEEHPAQMNPKIALQMLELAIKTGRMALGLSDKPGASASGPNINIHQTATAGHGAETSSTVEMTGQGPPKPTPGTQDLSHLQSILHILDKSGALDKAKIVEAEFTAIDED